MNSVDPSEAQTLLKLGVGECPEDPATISDATTEDDSDMVIWLMFASLTERRSRLHSGGMPTGCADAYPRHEDSRSLNGRRVCTAANRSTAYADLCSAWPEDGGQISLRRTLAHLNRAASVLPCQRRGRMQAVGSHQPGICIELSRDRGRNHRQRFHPLVTERFRPPGGKRLRVRYDMPTFMDIECHRRVPGAKKSRGLPRAGWREDADHHVTQLQLASVDPWWCISPELVAVRAVWVGKDIDCS